MIIVMMNRLKKERKKAYDGLISLLLIETCIDGYMVESIDWVVVFQLYLIGILQERDMANFLVRFGFCLVLHTKINLDHRTIGKCFFPQLKLIVENEVHVVCFRGQPLTSFYVGLFYFGDEKSKSFWKLGSLRI